VDAGNSFNRRAQECAERETSRQSCHGG